MLNVSIKLTGSNLDAIHDALVNAAQLISDGERSGNMGGGNIIEGEFFVGGHPTYDDDTINEAFQDALKASFDNEPSIGNELISLALISAKPSGVLVFDKESARFSVVYLKNSPAALPNEHIALDDVYVTIDDDEAFEEAYAAMYETLGYHGEFDKDAANVLIGTKHSSDLIEKRNDHVFGLIKDTLMQKDWAAWSIDVPGRIKIARDIVKARGFS